MKKTLLLAAALACSGAVAQEKQVWACQMESSIMLFWENNEWNPLTITPYNILLTLNADNTGSVDESRDTPTFSIDCSASYGSKFSCLDINEHDHFLLDPSTGKLGVSSLLGATMTGGYRDSVSAKVFNCTKF